MAVFTADRSQCSAVTTARLTLPPFSQELDDGSSFAVGDPPPAGDTDDMVSKVIDTWQRRGGTAEARIEVVPQMDLGGLDAMGTEMLQQIIASIGQE